MVAQKWRRENSDESRLSACGIFSRNGGRQHAVKGTQHSLDGDPGVSLVFEQRASIADLFGVETTLENQGRVVVQFENGAFGEFALFLRFRVVREASVFHVPQYVHLRHSNQRCSSPKRHSVRGTFDQPQSPEPSTYSQSRRSESVSPGVRVV